jgi:hypothetical protein
MPRSHIQREFAITGAIALLLGIVLQPAIALAQSAPFTRLSTPQTQRLYRDLVRSGTDDFFQQGRAQLEREIRQLTQPPTATQPLLTIQAGELRQDPEPFGPPRFLPKDLPQAIPLDD